MASGNNVIGHERTASKLVKFYKSKTPLRGFMTALLFKREVQNSIFLLKIREGRFLVYSIFTCDARCHYFFFVRGLNSTETKYPETIAILMPVAQAESPPFSAP